MGLSFSKSVRFGAVRFNFSGRGIGMSVGIPGLRIGTGPRGAYISGGMGGFRYHKSLSSPGRSSAGVRTLLGGSGGSGARGGFSPGPAIPSDADNISHTIEHDTANVLTLTDASSDDLLRSMNEQRAKLPFWPFVLVAVGLLNVFLGNMAQAFAVTHAPGDTNWASISQGIALVVGLPALAWTVWRDRMRKLTVLFYEPDQKVQTLFEALHAAAKSASTARRMQSIAQTSVYRDSKYTAGAGHGLKLKGALVLIGQAPGVRCNVDVPLIRAGATTIAFFPDRVLIFKGSAVGGVSYAALIADSRSTKFVEKEGVPSDTRILERTWQYVNKNGGPDRRFKNNREYPVCEYNAFSMSTAEGLDVRLMASRPGAFDAMVSALGGMRPLAM